MRRFLQRCRGAVGLALTWGAVWGAIFAGIFLVIGLFDPGSIGLGEGAGVIIRTGAILGVVSGGVFGVLLAVAERGKELGELSLARVALWGAIATAVFPLLTPADNSMLAFLCPIGATVAAASVAVARRTALETPADRPGLPGDRPELPG